ncbi:MAG: thiamine pyrophosphate-binding protein, partial [Lentisphaeria bacterium]|nr:thiamine pyrophosphate-binding protein [Lentisphaeria bacterium]
MSTTVHSGGEAVVETLAAAGVDTVFGIPGGHSLPIYAALYGHRQVRHVLGRHEQGLGYMADGYARASGRMAAVTTTSGPGVANIIAALAQATTDNVPMVVVSSAPPAALIGRNRGGLHDLNNVAFANPIKGVPTGAAALNAFLLDQQINLQVELQAREATGETKVV